VSWTRGERRLQRITAPPARLLASATLNPGGRAPRCEPQYELPKQHMLLLELLEAFAAHCASTVLRWISNIVGAAVRCRLRMTCLDCSQPAEEILHVLTKSSRSPSAPQRLETVQSAAHAAPCPSSRRVPAVTSRTGPVFQVEFLNLVARQQDEFPTLQAQFPPPLQFCHGIDEMAAHQSLQAVTSARSLMLD
jgi:hypothetical protein